VKVLVDTCVWSLALRRKSNTSLAGDEQRMVATLADAVRDGRVVIVGPIRQEVLSGIKDPSQFEKLRGTLAAFHDEPLTTLHFEEAARLFNLCRSRGVACGPVDILICTLAVHNRWAILTSDEGLKRCMGVLKSEGILH